MRYTATSGKESPINRAAQVYDGRVSEPNRLHALVDALPENEVAVAISFLTELGEQEIVDPETAAKLEEALAEPGEDVPIEEVRRRLGI